MKKVGRLRLSELEGRMDTLTKAEQHEYLGGNNTWRIYGGYLYEVEGGTLFCGDNGKFVWFPGISVSSDWVTGGAAYQYGGTIHVDEDWSNFDINDFAHEYGHYLQQKDKGYWSYILNVAIPSMYTAGSDPGNHSTYWYEQDATQRGEHVLYDQGYYY